MRKQTFWIPASLARGRCCCRPAIVQQPSTTCIGTRFVAPDGHGRRATATTTIDPCRTLHYALTQVAPGDAIKLAAGSYDVSGIDVENLLLGKEGVRGGYSAEDHFAHPERGNQSHARLRRARRVPQQLHRARLHRGGRQRRSAAAHHHAETARAHRLHGRHARAPSRVTTSTISRRCSCRKFPPRPPAPATSGASSISTTTANTPCSAIATARRSTT